jgi:hypothetical protein
VTPAGIRAKRFARARRRAEEKLLGKFGSHRMALAD